jgi:hypothetical protein
MEGSSYLWVVADNQRPITQGLKLKLVRTSAKMHTMCVMDGPVMTYKLHAHAFRGKMDDDLQSLHENVATTQKWVNLMDVILSDFMGKGRASPWTPPT